MKSKNLSAVDDPLENQRTLPLKREKMNVDIELVRRQPTFSKSISLCAELAGFEYDSQIYQELEIDAGHWTRIMNGSANFPENKLNKLMDVCGNEAPLMWLSDYRGYELKRKLSAVEAELLETKQRADEGERKIAILMEVINGGRT